MFVLFLPQTLEDLPRPRVLHQLGAADIEIEPAALGGDRHLQRVTGE